MTSESAAARITQHERDENDWYVEPRWSVDALLDAERFCGEVFDPACGGANIVDTCRARGLHSWGSDLIDRCAGRFPSGIDFTQPVAERDRESVDNIISNPPFKHAEAFIPNALERARYKVAMLVRLAFLEGQKRRAMFESLPMSRVLIFSRRLSMPPGGRDIKQKGGAVAFCWLVFDHDHQGPATVGWLP